MCVCVCVRSFVVILSNLEHSNHLKEDVLWVLQGCLGCLRVSQVVSRVFQKRPNGALRVFQECFMGVSRKVSRKFQEN